MGDSVAGMGFLAPRLASPMGAESLPPSAVAGMGFLAPRLASPMGAESLPPSAVSVSTASRRYVEPFPGTKQFMI